MAAAQQQAMTDLANQVAAKQRMLHELTSNDIIARITQTARRLADITNAMNGYAVRLADKELEQEAYEELEEESEAALERTANKEAPNTSLVIERWIQKTNRSTRKQTPTGISIGWAGQESGVDPLTIDGSLRDAEATVVADVPDGLDKNNANKFTTKKLEVNS